MPAWTFDQTAMHEHDCNHFLGGVAGRPNKQCLNYLRYIRDVCVTKHGSKKSLPVSSLFFIPK